MKGQLKSSKVRNDKIHLTGAATNPWIGFEKD